MERRVSEVMKKMTKYEVKAVASDYGIFENGELKLIVISQANALMIKNVLEQELKHKVVIKDLLEPKKKPKRKFRTMTYGEFCEKWLKQYYCCADGIHETLKNVCPFYGLSKATLCDYNEVYTQEPCKLLNGKYILIEDCNTEVKK